MRNLGGWTEKVRRLGTSSLPSTVLPWPSWRLRDRPVYCCEPSPTETPRFLLPASTAGAVTQVLYQKNNIHQYWLYHKESPELKDSRPDAVKCVVITGMLPKDELQRRSFEVFRNSSKDVEIITFDELLAKLRLLSEHLASPETDNSEPPF
ncbi:DUF4263 domain-containing protein [Pseudomonas aeruginosa]|nr:DUF4263 domain-containing protein [Pseudomonas aeruginosa]